MIEKGSLRSRSVHAVAWSAVHGWGSQFIGLIVFTVLAKLLQPADFGLLAMASVFVAIAGIFMDQGLAQALVQRKEIEPEHIDTAFWINFVSGIVLAAIGWLVSPWVASLYSAPELTSILRALCLTIVLRSGAAVQIALLQRELDYRTLAMRNFLGLIVGGIVGVSLAFLGFGVWSLVWQQVANALILSITLWWFCPWKPKFRFSVKHFRDLYSFGLYIVGSNIAGFVNSQSDKAIIGVYLGPTALGYYALAHRLLTIMIALLSGVTATVSLPVFSSLQNDMPRLREAFMAAIRLSALVAFPAFLGLAITAPILLPTVFDPKWVESVEVIQILAISGAVYSTLYFHGNLFVSVGKPHWRLILNSSIAVLKLISFFMIVQYGIVAIAISNVVFSYVAAPISLYLAKKLISLDLRKYGLAILEPLAASIIMVVILYGSMLLMEGNITPVLQLIISIALGIVVYAGAAWFLAPTTSRELYHMITHVIIRRRKVATS